MQGRGLYCLLLLVGICASIHCKRPTSMHWRPQHLVASYSFAIRGYSYSLSNSAGGSRHRERAFTSSSTASAAETSAAGANPYPFPQKSRPTPLEIFHLPSSATPKQIKHRCTHLSLAHPLTHDSVWLNSWAVMTVLLCTRFRIGQDLSSGLGNISPSSRRCDTNPMECH